jgi:hypothetical protein
MRVRFRGIPYTIRFDPHRPKYGECSNPALKSPKITFRASLQHPKKGKILLETAIHEALHACAWDMDEQAVHETAESITNLLWKLGFRRAEP